MAPRHVPSLESTWGFSMTLSPNPWNSPMALRSTVVSGVRSAPGAMELESSFSMYSETRRPAQLPPVAARAVLDVVALV